MSCVYCLYTVYTFVCLLMSVCENVCVKIVCENVGTVLVPAHWYGASSPRRGGKVVIMTSYFMCGIVGW